MDLSAHCAVVVGAAGAIGAAISRAYVECGATIWIVDIDAAGLERLASDLGEASRALVLNVTDPRAVGRAADRLWEEAAIDSVVYAAGVDVTADVTALDWEAYRRLMAINLDGAFYVAAAFGRRMLTAQHPGSFVFLSSMAGKRGEAGAAPYCASKFGLIGLVQSFAAEVAVRGIRVNAICPGNVDSPLLRTIARRMADREGESYEAMIDRFARAAAANRLVRPEEVAAVAVWLASTSASAITGESINVDAGALSG